MQRERGMWLTLPWISLLFSSKAFCAAASTSAASVFWVLSRWESRSVSASRETTWALRAWKLQEMRSVSCSRWWRTSSYPSEVWSPVLRDSISARSSSYDAIHNILANSPSHNTELRTFRRSTVATRVFARSKSATTISISARLVKTSWSAHKLWAYDMYGREG